MKLLFVPDIPVAVVPNAKFIFGCGRNGLRKAGQKEILLYGFQKASICKGCILEFIVLLFTN